MSDLGQDRLGCSGPDANWSGFGRRVDPPGVGGDSPASAAPVHAATPYYDPASSNTWSSYESLNLQNPVPRAADETAPVDYLADAVLFYNTACAVIGENDDATLFLRLAEVALQLHQATR